MRWPRSRRATSAISSRRNRRRRSHSTTCSAAREPTRTMTRYRNAVDVRAKAAIGIVGVLTVLGVAVLPALAATKNVAVKDFEYKPASITIVVGSTVHWTDMGDAPHSVTAKNGSFDSSDAACTPSGGPTCMSKGDTFDHKFTSTGTFVYFCRVHCPNDSCGQGGMRGRVIVKAAATPVPTFKPTPAPEQTSAPQRTNAATPAPLHATASSSPTATRTTTPSPTVTSLV